MPYCKYSSDRAPGWEHIPLYPKGFIGIRIVQLVTAILITGLSAYVLYIHPFDGGIFSLAVGTASLITSTYHLIARYSNPKAYNYWAILVLDVSLVVFWLACLGTLASKIIYITSLSRYEIVSSTWLNDNPNYDPTVTGDYSYEYETLDAVSDGGKKTLLTGRSSSSNVYFDDGLHDLGRRANLDDWSVLPFYVTLLSALGGVEFILHIISLTIHSVFLHRHRAAGLHSKPVNYSSSSSESGTALVPPSAGIHNANRPFQLDSTPVPIPHIQIQNHSNQSQQPSLVPSPASSYTPTCSNQPYLKQQPYLSPEQPQDQQRQYQPYQPFPAHGQGQGSIQHSTISPQTTGGTTYTQFQRSLAVSPIPAPTQPVPSHQGMPAGIYQLP